MKCKITTGNEIYGSMFYADKLFYICDCGCYVGVHKGTDKPLGTIPTAIMRKWRREIHSILDPIWKNSKRWRKTRARIYGYISKNIGYEYHTANISSEDEYMKVLEILLKLKTEDWFETLKEI